MIGEIVSATTADHVRLHGFFRKADSETGETNEPGTALFVHGLSGNFYSSRLLTFLADQSVRSGLNALIVNTRGHDVLNNVSRGGRIAHFGAVFERVGDCVLDLTAWSKWLENRVGGSITLVGHSLGAIKSLYTQSRQPIENVSRLVALSATRLNHQSLLASSRGDRFQELYSQATEMVEAGQADELLSVDFPFPTWMSAGAYYEKYGPKNEYDWLEFIDKLNVPSLMIFGERELNNNPAFQGLESKLAERIEFLDNIHSETIEGADHFYSGKFESTWEKISNWLEQHS